MVEVFLDEWKNVNNNQLTTIEIMHDCSFSVRDLTLLLKFGYKIELISRAYTSTRSFPGRYFLTSRHTIF